METIRTTTVLLVVALALAGCAQSPEAERVQPTLTQLEPVEQPTEVTNPYGLDDQTIDTLFLANVRDLAPVMVGVPDADLFSAADAICDAFDSGVTFDAIALTALFALTHGVAHGLELPALTSPWGYAAGFIVATAALHASGYALVRLLPQAAAPLVRMLGAASALTGAWLLAG